MRLAILLLLLSVPTAAACSFAGPVPGPAKMTLVPDDGGPERVIAIQGRMSGAMCELSNPHLLAGSEFVWLEYHWNPSKRIVHVLDLDTGAKRVVELAHADMDGFGYWNGSVVYRARTYNDQMPPDDALYLQAVSGGEPHRLPFPLAYYSSVAFADGLVAAVRTDGGYSGNSTFYLYDIGAGSWLAEGVPATELVNTSRLRLGPMGSGWLYLIAQDQPILYDIVNGTPLRKYDRDMPPLDEHPMTIADGYAYSWTPDRGEIRRMRLPDGEVETLAAEPGFVGRVAGYTVYGDYSAPELNWWWPHRWVLDAAPWLLVGAFVLSTPVIWWWRKRRA